MRPKTVLPPYNYDVIEKNIHAGFSLTCFIFYVFIFTFALKWEPNFLLFDIYYPNSSMYWFPRRHSSYKRDVEMEHSCYKICSVFTTFFTLNKRDISATNLVVFINKLTAITVI